MPVQLCTPVTSNNLSHDSWWSQHSVPITVKQWYTKSSASATQQPFSAGTADSFLKASHIARTRHAHQVTASSMYILLKITYAHYLESLEPECQAETFDDWFAWKNQVIPQFNFWHTALQLKHVELLVLIYTRHTLLCMRTAWPR